MNKWIDKIEYKVSNRLLYQADEVIDQRICGVSLVPYVPSIFRDDQRGVGGTGSQSTHYLLLRRVFSHVSLTASDSFMDVGCGKGRVLAYLIRKKCPCALYGIEYNETVGKIAADWTERYEQAHIIIGDALSCDYNAYTVLSLARSFLPKTFLAFAEHLEQTLRHPVRLIYWYDQESGYLLKNRPGWKMLMRENVFRIHGIRIAPCPQGYSIWLYDPEQREDGRRGKEKPGGA